MMNDRFAAGLRQHLVDTANERPAEGQLAAVVERVAVTAQRPPLVVRLAGFPGRIRPFPSTALRWALVAAALLTATMAVANLGGGGGPARSTVFEGTWTAIDPADGSVMTLAVAAGFTPAIRFEDGFATGPACVADDVKVFTAEGTGQVSMSRLAVSYPFGGGCGLMVVDLGPGFLDYDEVTDTMLGSDGITWSRVREGETPPTQPPATQPATIPAPTQVPDGDPRCIDLHGGGDYGASVGSLTLTATLPADTSWQGLSDGFLLSRFGCFDPGSPVWIEAQVITRVYTDLCDPAAGSVAVDSSVAAMAILQPLVGLEEVGPTDVTLGGYAGRRLDFYVRPDFGSAACPEGSGRAFDGLSNFVPELNATVHLLDVDGTVLALVTYWSADSDPVTVAEVDAVVASLRIEP